MDLISQFGVDRNDLQPYLPANPAQIKQKNIDVHYLGYYQNGIRSQLTTMRSNMADLRHPQNALLELILSITALMIELMTCIILQQVSNLVLVAQAMTPHKKFALVISRDEGVALVNRFDHEYPERFIEEMFEYLSLPESEFSG